MKGPASHTLTFLSLKGGGATRSEVFIALLPVFTNQVPHLREYAYPRTPAISCSHLCHPPAPCIHTLRHAILACYPYLHNLCPQLINCCTIKLTLIPASTFIPMGTPAHLHSQLTPSPSPPHVHTHICDPAHTPSYVSPHNILTSTLIHTYTRTDPHSFILTHVQLRSSSCLLHTSYSHFGSCANSCSHTPLSI